MYVMDDNTNSKLQDSDSCMNHYLVTKLDQTRDKIKFLGPLQINVTMI